MPGSDGKGCESVFKCNPMILFLVCFLCGCIGNVVSISSELASDDNLEEKITKSGGKLLSIICGFLCNLYCWVYLADVSWLWWNVIGFIITFKIAVIHSFFFSKSQTNKSYVWSFRFFKELGFNNTWINRYIILFIWFIFIFCLIYFL